MGFGYFRVSYGKEQPIAGGENALTDGLYLFYIGH
jgi:hypothetical protein